MSEHETVVCDECGSTNLGFGLTSDDEPRVTCFDCGSVFVSTYMEDG